MGSKEGVSYISIHIKEETPVFPPPPLSLFGIDQLIDTRKISRGLIGLGREEEAGLSLIGHCILSIAHGIMVDCNIP